MQHGLQAGLASSLLHSPYYEGSHSSCEDDTQRYEHDVSGLHPFSLDFQMHVHPLQVLSCTMCHSEPSLSTLASKSCSSEKFFSEVSFQRPDDSSFIVPRDACGSVAASIFLFQVSVMKHHQGPLR